MEKKFYAIISVIIIVAMLLASCAAGGNGEEVANPTDGITTSETGSNTTEPEVSTEEDSTENTTKSTTESTTETTTKETTTAKPTTTQKQTTTQSTTKKESTTKKTTTTTTTTKPTTTQKATTTTTTTTQNAITEKDKKAIEERVVYYINQYRKAEGNAAGKVLPRMTEYAERRAVQLKTNYEHSATDARAAATAMKFGQYNSSEYLAAVGFTDTTPFYDPLCGEAIFKSDSSFQTIDEFAKRLADACYNSKGHWRVVGSSEVVYIACGLSYGKVSGEPYNWSGCVVVSNVDPDTVGEATLD